LQPTALRRPRGPARVLLHPSALILVLALPCLLLAQVTFMRIYGGARADDGYSVLQTADGGYVIAGLTWSFGAGGTDAWLIKTDSLGDTMWTRTYGGAGHDMGASLLQTAEGGYVLTGYWASDSSGSELWLVKTDSSGDTLWTRTFGGDGKDYGWSVLQTADDGYVIAGLTWSFGAGGADFWLIKTDSSGDTMWTRTYGGTSHDEGFSVVGTADGGFVVTGCTGSFGAGDGDVWLVKTDSSGDTMWTRTFGGADDDCGYSVAQTSDGGYILVAETRSSGAGETDAWLLKTDSSGDTLWTRVYGGVRSDECYSLALAADGGYIIAGSTRSFAAGESDVWLLKTDSLGDTMWTRTYGGADFEVGKSVAKTADGGFVITGHNIYVADGPGDLLLIKTDSAGRVAIGEMPEPKRAETLGPTVLMRAQLLAELQQDPILSLFDASGRIVTDGNSVSPGVVFMRSGTTTRKVLVIR
jgi:hypothetical protein